MIEKEHKFKATEFLIRFATMFFSFVILSLYLYLIQLTYDSLILKDHPLKKSMLFSSTIFGAGLIWDIAKHLAFLEINNLKIFIKSLRNAAGWALCYVLSGAITYFLTNKYAGWGTIFIVYTFFLGLVSCAFFIRAATKAIDSAVEKTK